jgi:hypothetical protein
MENQIKCEKWTCQQKSQSPAFSQIYICKLKLGLGLSFGFKQKQLVGLVYEQQIDWLIGV